MTRPLFQLALASMMLAPALVTAAIDWRTHRVPNLLVTMTFVPALVAVLITDDRIHLLTSVASGALVMAVPLLLVHLVAPAAMGFGDVKLAAALGAGIGVLAPKLAVPALAAACGVTLLAAAWRQRPSLPFAPGLVLGSATALAIGATGAWSSAT
jgi:leader peptidase (prepilin peptidase)/N-methyltransferase